MNFGKLANYTSWFRSCILLLVLVRVQVLLKCLRLQFVEISVYQLALYKL